MALVAVLASCSKSNVVEVPYENMPISFTSYNGKTPTVKSSSFVGNDSIAKYGFQVYGYLHQTAEQAPVYTAGTEYMNKVVNGTKENETWKWTYEGVSYWPGTMYLDFVAYGLNASTIVTADNTNSNILNVNVPAEVSAQKDLLVAVPQKNVQYNDAEGGNNGVVALNFKHLLSRVSFALVTKDANPVNVTIEDITLTGNFNTQGTIDLTQVDENNVPSIVATAPTAATTYSFLGTDGTFTSTGDVEAKGGSDIFNNSMLWTLNTKETESKNDDEYVAVAETTEGYADLTAAATANKENRFMMIMPTEGTTHGAELNVTYFLPFAGSYTVEDIDLTKINFEAGKSYKFLLKVSTNAISFSVEITDWVDAVGGTSENKEVIELN